jgi:predicted nucleic acid-binding protein
VTWVVDASIAVKWVIPEVLSEQADRIRDSDDDVLAPDLLLVEVANALWRKTVAREITPREADTASGSSGEVGSIFTRRSRCCHARWTWRGA